MHIKTGIPGLDDHVGGFLKGSSTLVTGNPGTGKTLFCCQFLSKGLKEGDNALYITTDEEAHEIVKDAESIGIDFNEYTKYSPGKPNFIIEVHKPIDLTTAMTKLQNKISAYRIGRVVIDSVSSLSHSSPNIKKDLQRLIKMMKDAGATLVMTGEIPYGHQGTLSGKEFHVDNVIKLNSKDGKRNMELRKFRRTALNQHELPIRIGPKGIVVE